MGQVRVTLEKPWGKKGTLVMRYGTTEAVRRSAENDYSSTTGHSFIKGKPILYPPDGSLIAGDAQSESTLMPEEVAKHFFGDWDIPQETANADDPRLTHGVEMRRVARVWGDFQMGARSDNTTPLGPPNIPFVVIHKMDARGNAIADFEFRPREHYGFDTMPYGDDGTPHIEVTAKMPEIDFESLKAQVKAELLAEMKKPKKQVHDAA